MARSTPGRGAPWGCVSVGRGIRVRWRAHRPLVAHHRVVVHPVIRALELEDLVALAVDARQTHREEGGLAAAAVEAHHFGARDVLDDLLAELHGVLVDDEVRRAPFRNGAKRLEDCGVRVAEHVWTRAKQVVDVLVAAHVPDVAALGLAYAEVELRVEGEATRLRWKEALGLGDERAFFVGALDHAALLSRFSRMPGYCSM